MQTPQTSENFEPPSVPAIDHPRYCLDCGYRLDNIISTRCPECGRAFALADKLTTSESGKLGSFGRWALGHHSIAKKPTRWIWPASIAVTALALLVSIVRLGEIVPSLLVLCIGFVAIAVPYLPRQLVRQHLVRKHGFPKDLFSIDAKPVRKSRRAFLIGAGLILVCAPFYLVFFLSLPALNRAADYEWNVRPACDPRPGKRMIGLFPVRSIEIADDGVAFNLPLGARLIYRESQDWHWSYYVPEMFN